MSQEIPAPEILSDAEKVVYRLVVQGFTGPQIANQLHRSLKTIENHRYAISRKLGIGNPAMLVRKHYETLVLPVLEAQTKLCLAACGAIAENPDCYCDDKRTNQKCNPCIARQAVDLCREVQTALLKGEKVAG